MGWLWLWCFFPLTVHLLERGRRLLFGIKLGCRWDFRTFFLGNVNNAVHGYGLRDGVCFSGVELHFGNGTLVEGTRRLLLTLLFVRDIAEGTKKLSIGER